MLNLQIVLPAGLLLLQALLNVAYIVLSLFPYFLPRGGLCHRFLLFHDLKYKFTTTTATTFKNSSCPVNTQPD